MAYVLPICRVKSHRGLPEGWEKKLTEKGKVYFIDHNSKETHWTVPEHLESEPLEGLSPRSTLLAVTAETETEEENQV